VRRFLSSAAEFLSGLFVAVGRGWNAFFFTPADPTSLGVIRLGVGALVFWSMFVYGLDLRDFFGSQGWAEPDTVRYFDYQAPYIGYVGRHPYAWSFWYWVPDRLLWPVWGLCMVVLALFTAGLWSRVTAVLAWVIVVSTVRRVPVSLFGFDQMTSTWTLYLAVCGASGQAVSLDRFLARYRAARDAVARRRQDGRWVVPPGAPSPSVAANLGLRLIQLHLVLIYGAAGFAKLQGAAWWNGTAIWGTIAAGEFRLFDLTWLAAYPLVLNVMTHSGLLFEVLYPFLIWNRWARPVLLAFAVALHVGIGLTLGLAEFSAAMLVGNFAFVSGPWLRSLVTGLRQPWARVLYDGACPRCRASMALIGAADPDHVIEPVDLTAVNVSAVHPSLTKEACLRAMHVVRADGRVLAGYDAVAALGRWCPLFFPLALVGSLPGVTALGRRAYNAIAASRPRDVPCTDETCGLHPPARGGAKRAAPAAESERARP
jgi:predicted DCC family thiol-disulfide oxidoreductase YuxK